MDKRKTAVLATLATSSLIIGIVFSITENLFDGYESWKKTLVVIIALIVSIIIAYLSKKIIVRYLFISDFYSEALVKENGKLDFTDELKSECPFHHAVCCGCSIMKQAPGLISLSTLSRSKFHLKMEEEINDIEKRIAAHKEVWVLSICLKSEVLGDDNQLIVNNNLNNGLIYRQFYTHLLDDIDDNDLIETNKKLLLDPLTPEGKRNLFFIPITRENKKCDYLIRLTEMVLFIKKNNELEGYFRLKSKFNSEDNPKSIIEQEVFNIRDESRKAIYFTMPQCMAIAYKQLLTKAMNNFEKTKKTKEEL